MHSWWEAVCCSACSQPNCIQLAKVPMCYLIASDICACFWLCACRSHFVKITSAPEAAAIRSRRDGVLWLWRVHNEVNERLHKVRGVAPGGVVHMRVGFNRGQQ